MTWLIGLLAQIGSAIGIWLIEKISQSLKVVIVQKEKDAIRDQEQKAAEDNLKKVDADPNSTLAQKAKADADVINSGHK